MEQKNTDFKKEYIKLIVIFSTVLIVVLTFFYLLSVKRFETIQSENNDESDTQVFEEVKEKYLIKEFNGKIGIFENDALIYTLDTYIFTLPKKDQKLLSEGISVSSKEELYEIIEEYY